jgi:pyroglutamyl-peptidase
MMKGLSCLAILGVLIICVPLVISGASAGDVVLVTGFEPFGLYAPNPSQLIAESLNGTTLNGAEIIGIVLPVDFNESVEKAFHAIEQYHPDLVLSLGLAARSNMIKIENIAVNFKRYPRDDGTWSFPKRIDKYGPFLRFSTLPTREITRRMQVIGIPARQSVFAGTYICNALFYGIGGYVKENCMNISYGFIHVPLLDSQDPNGIPLETLVEAVTLAINVSLGEHHLCRNDR